MLFVVEWWIESNVDIGRATCKNARLTEEGSAVIKFWRVTAVMAYSQVERADKTCPVMIRGLIGVDKPLLDPSVGNGGRLRCNSDVS